MGSPVFSVGMHVRSIQDLEAASVCEQTSHILVPTTSIVSTMALPQ